MQCRVTFIDGKMQGLRYQWEDDGFLIETVTYSNGIRNGIRTYYEDDGSIEIDEIVNDRRNGIHIKFYPNGQRMRMCTFKNGSLQGKYKHWSSDGVKSPDFIEGNNN